MKQQVPENPSQNRNKENALMVLSCLLVTFYLTANIMAVKIVSIRGISLFDAGTITFPFAYMLGDTLTEIWGFRATRRVIFLTFLCNLILVVSTWIGLYLPSPDSMAKTTEAYATVFGYVPRIVVASLAAFLFGELSNALAMVKIKQRTHGRHLWLRTIGSSAIGYVFDSVLFVLIAFAGTVSARDCLTMILTQYLLKLGLESVAGTPLAYALIAHLRRSFGETEETPWKN